MDIQQVRTIIYRLFRVAAILPVVVFSQTVQFTPDRGFAKESLNNYIRHVVTAENSMQFGFASLDEARTADIGKAISIMCIRLDTLKAGASKDSAKTLFVDVKRLWYPVMVQGAVKASLEISYRGEKPRAGDFGRSAMAKLIWQSIELVPKLAEDRNLPEPSDLLLVKIPALHIDLIYFRVPGKGEFFLPTNAGGIEGVETGKLYSAAELLEKIGQVAKNIDPDKFM